MGDDLPIGSRRSARIRPAFQLPASNIWVVVAAQKENFGLGLGLQLRVITSIEVYIGLFEG